jgi:hypothetical protein
MRKPATQKFSSLMSRVLLERLRREAESNGQSVRFLLENAVKHYLEVVLPYARGVRPEVLPHIEASFVENQELIRRLAKSPK